MLQEGMSTEAAGLCVRRSSLFGRKRLKPTRTVVSALVRATSPLIYTMVESQGEQKVHHASQTCFRTRNVCVKEAILTPKCAGDVGEDLVNERCAERWGWCRGRVTYKVRKEKGKE